MEWCEYFEALGKYRPECARYRPALQAHYSSDESDEVSNPDREEFERTAVIRLVKQSGRTCAPYKYYVCVKNDLCSSGKICMQSNGMSCCEPFPNKCPEIDALGISCNIANPINWCNTDVDCHSTPIKRCCPSGCNYNICI
uniref:WAP domain-containing protein n=1 Tax=Syphacia muris TaxID=451379 RepID=A0A158R3Y6_9BILA